MSYTYKHLRDEDIARLLEADPGSEANFAAGGPIFRAPGTLAKYGELREMIREEVEQALHPGMPDPRSYIHAEMRDPETGQIYRGMLYLIEPMPQVEDATKND